MKFQFQQTLKALILLAFAGLLFKLHYSGEIAKYINVKYSIWSQIASVMFVFLFFIQLERSWSHRQRAHDHAHAEADGVDDPHVCDHAGCDHDHGFSGWSLKTAAAYAVIAFPLITGFLLPPKILDASVAAKKGTLLAQPKTGNESAADHQKTTLPEPLSDRTDAMPPNGNTGSNRTELNVKEPNPDTLTDNAAGGEAADPSGTEAEERAGTWEDMYSEEIEKLTDLPSIDLNDQNFVSYTDTIHFFPEKFAGKRIKISGFVYKEPGMSEEQLVVARFIITHCVADAGVIGFLAKWNEAGRLQKDTWIEIQGTLGVTTYDDAEMPVIQVDGWKKIQAPKDPYVYPVY